MPITFIPGQLAPRAQIYERSKARAPQTVLIFIEGDTAFVQGADIETAQKLGIETQVPAARADYLKRRFVVRRVRVSVTDLNEVPPPRPVFARRHP